MSIYILIEMIIDSWKTNFATPQGERENVRIGARGIERMSATERGSIDNDGSQLEFGSGSYGKLEIDTIIIIKSHNSCKNLITGKIQLSSTKTFETNMIYEHVKCYETPIVNHQKGSAENSEYGKNKIIEITKSTMKMMLHKEFIVNCLVVYQSC